MAEDTDGMEEALAGQIRVMVTAAGLVGESIARAREQQQRRAQATSTTAARIFRPVPRVARVRLGFVGMLLV